MLKVQIDVYHHFPSSTGGNQEVLAAIHQLSEDVNDMNAKLQIAVAALAAQLSADDSKLDAVTTIIQGVPDLVAAAVAKALADADVADTDAADAIDAARNDVQGHVDTLLAAAGVTDTGNGGDTTGGTDGGGTDTTGGGTGSDTISAPDGAENA